MDLEDRNVQGRKGGREGSKHRSPALFATLETKMFQTKTFIRPTVMQPSD